MSFLLPLVLSVIGALAVEASSPPRPISRKGSDLAIRLTSYAAITGFWFMFSWRPWLAAATCVATVLTTTAVSRLKLKVIGESLVFSDIALLGQVPRHPELYYALPLSNPRVVVLALFGSALVLLWYLTEPTLLPDWAGGAITAFLALPTALLALIVAARRPPIADWLQARFPRPDLEADVKRYGVLATMIAYALRRDVENRAPQSCETSASKARLRFDEDVFIVVQLESFVDPERLGRAPLPLMARIRAQSAQHGRLRVSVHGAYTMRSEHAVLTGRDPAELGFGLFDPYLAFGGRDPSSLAELARRSGCETVFVHPYHRDFFDRAGVVSRLGFDRLIMQDDFGDAPRVGPYIGDEAVAERILSELRDRRGPLFVFAVTMENHGPWKAGRLPGIDDPLAQYEHHVANTGRAVERLIDALEGMRATLCVFGDHPPSLPANRPGSHAPETDYAIFKFGHPSAAPPERLDIAAFELGLALRQHFAQTGERPPGDA